jgi:glutamine phosphoribosylpyrophosphate amidotransferase
MCGLFGSNDVSEFKQLFHLNTVRGSHSHSVSVLDGLDVEVRAKQIGTNLAEYDSDEDVLLWMGHIQAPTTSDRDVNSIHPSEINGSYLWHNGIIHSQTVTRWQEELETEVSWDTRLMHQMLLNKSFDVLNDIEGSFACIFFLRGDLYMFRNDNSPLYVKDSSYSSVMFDGACAIEPNIVYILADGTWTKTSYKFVNKDQFFWSPF